MRALKIMLMVLVGVMLFSWARKTDFSSICPPIICAEENEGNSSGDPTEDPVKVESAFLVVLERYPMKAILALKGELPSPCHELVWEVTGPDERDIIEVTSYAKSAPQKFCIQVLEPFEVQIPLGDFFELGFSVHLNGEAVGEL